MKNVKFIKNKKIINWIFTGILFIGAFGITNININNSDKNKYAKNSILDTEIISGLANNDEDEKIMQLSMQGYFSSVLSNQGNVYTWGDNGNGQLGDGTNTSKNTPINIPDKFSGLGENGKITQLSGSEYSLSALSNHGSAYTWGMNDSGQLGDGTNTSKNTPTKITFTDLVGEEKITQLNMGGRHSSALTDKGNVYTWGKNGNGQLGDGTNTNKNTPTKITFTDLVGEEKITQLNMGGRHSSALTDKGNVYTWGMNDSGQLGDGTNTNKNTPTKITDKFGGLGENEKITQLDMSDFHFSSALTNKGNVYTWGKNNHGQLGDGTNDDKNTPTKITFTDLVGEEKITQLSVGGYHLSALTDKGNVYTWGLNNSGQLGDGTNDNKKTPTKITFTDLVGEEKITQLNMGEVHSSALTDQDVVYTWGRHWEGQLGRGGPPPIPRKVDFPSLLGFVNTTSITTNSVTINFDVTKNDQNGNVTIKDEGDNVKGTEDNVDGPSSITIDNLTSNTTFTGWTIEVDGNGEVPIPDFKTAIKSELSDIDPKNPTTNSVEIHFTVIKNDQDGNVVIKDKDDNVKGNKKGASGSTLIRIDGLTSNTIYIGWTIEVDDNGEVEIPEFETAAIKSELSDIDPKNPTTNSVEIHFTVIKNDQDGNVVIKDKDDNVKGNKKGASGATFIGIDGLTSNTIYIGWTIEVDNNGEVEIPEFETAAIKSELSDIDPKNPTTNSVEIHFTVIKNDQDGNVVIKDKDDNVKGNKKGASGATFIGIDGLTSNTTFTGWTIEADDNGEVEIPEFETAAIKSELSDIDPKNPTTNSVEIHFTVIKNDQDGNVVIKDKDDKEKGRKESVDGKGSIIIDNLTSNITYAGWTIDVDGEGKKPIPDFTTLEYSSNDIEKDVDIKIKGKLKDSDKQITFQYSQNKLNGTIHHIITYKDGTEQSTSPLYDNYFNGSGEKTYDLNQTIETISEIETIYTIDGYPVVLNSHTGSADKVLGDSIIKPGLSAGGVIIGIILLAGLTGIMLILLMIYYFQRIIRWKKLNL